MRRRNAFELVCEPERASAACEHKHANESVAVCDMMLCRIELQKRCTNEQTLHMQQYTHARGDGEGGRCIYVVGRFTGF